MLMIFLFLLLAWRKIKKKGEGMFYSESHVESFPQQECPVCVIVKRKFPFFLPLVAPYFPS